MTESPIHFDLVFLGGGLASSMISRYLKLKYPELAILVLEKGTQASWSPGESTVGVAGLFMMRDLGLSTYAYLNQLPKNGLRFLFTQTNEPFDLRNCSEIGSCRLPVFPTFQVDRKRIVEDLWNLNEEIGIKIQLGCSVEKVDISDSRDAHHGVTFNHGDISSRVTCKWIINGSGRGSHFAPIFNELSKFKEDPDHCTAAAWGRYTQVEDIDQLGDEAWRAKVGFTSRYLSTNHFMGEGYWIWAIPIDRGIVSFGVVYDKKVVTQDLTHTDAFNTFLRNHPISGLLLKNARQEDFQSHPHLPFKREVFCSKDRWALIGDSFMFVDPFYSPGSDVIAREARHIEHLINSPPEELNELTELLNQYTKLEYELLKKLYVNQYGGFGSYEVYDIKSFWDFYSYTNTVLWPYFTKCHENTNWLKAQVELANLSLALVGAIQNGFIALASHLRDTGQLECHNLRKYSSRQNHFLIEDEMLLGKYSHAASKKHHLHLCRLTVSELIQSRFQISGFADKKIIQEQLTFETLAQFKLTPSWLDFFLQKVGEAIATRIFKETGRKVECALTHSSLSEEVPTCFGRLPQEIQVAALAIWKDPYDCVIRF